ncbi:RNA polymerase sigma-70 factor [Nannocystaceae bacterium ST9]
MSDDFASARPRLFAIAYRMLGSAADAEDVVQDAFLRWQAHASEAIESPRAWLSTVTTRLCLDRLGSARARREHYVGPWLPEPISTRDEIERHEELESISLAFLVVLDSLSPLERAAFLLHEVFDYSHAEVGAILERDEATCRQLLRRARQHLADRRPRFAATREQHRDVLLGFLGAIGQGDVTTLERMLAADVSACADGGGRVSAATKVVSGSHDVARYMIGMGRKGGAEVGYELAEINGWPSLLLRRGTTVFLVLSIETDGERIHAIRMVLNPDKLEGLRS